MASTAAGRGRARCGVLNQRRACDAGWHSSTTRSAVPVGVQSIASLPPHEMPPANTGGHAVRAQVEHELGHVVEKPTGRGGAAAGEFKLTASTRKTLVARVREQRTGAAVPAAVAADAAGTRAAAAAGHRQPPAIVKACNRGANVPGSARPVPPLRTVIPSRAGSTFTPAAPGQHRRHPRGRT